MKSNSVGSGYMSHFWTSAFDEHFSHGFVILKDVQHRTKSRKLSVRRDAVNIVQIKIVVPGWNLGVVLSVLVWCGVTRRVSSFLIFDVVELVWRRMKQFHNQIPKIKSHACTCIERNYFSFCRTVWNWSLFLAHPTYYWYERVTSENAQESTWCWFWVFWISGRIRVLKQS